LDAAEGAAGERTERLDQIVDLGHPLAKLARAVDWRFLEDRFGAVYSDRAGHPPLPTGLMAGLSILKSMYDLSDEELCARWIENPYFQLCCGEEFFQHKTPFDRSSLTRWRPRMGDEKLTALIQESLATATRTGAAKASDFSRVIVDTTVQPKAVAFPTDAKLMHRARERLVRLAKKTGVLLRQSYQRVGKRALIAHQRYAHAKQFKRANRALRTIRTYLGRVCHDLVRKTGDDAQLRAIFAQPCRSPLPCASSAAISAAGRSIPCTPPRSNGSARARRTGLTSSTSRSRSPRLSTARKAASSSPT
jgi:IS5 family transposase